MIEGLILSEGAEVHDLHKHVARGDEPVWRDEHLLPDHGKIVRASLAVGRSIHAVAHGLYVASPRHVVRALTGALQGATKGVAESIRSME